MLLTHWSLNWCIKVDGCFITPCYWQYMCTLSVQQCTVWGEGMEMEVSELPLPCPWLLKVPECVLMNKWGAAFCTQPNSPAVWLCVSCPTPTPVALAWTSAPACSQSIVRVVFHDRRLQYMEHQQLEGWRWNRPGDRILDIGKSTVPIKISIDC